MRFEEALPLAREGRRIARDGWNGKCLWVAMQTPDAHSEMGMPYLYIKSVDGKLVPWAPSQTDLLADDWSALIDKAEERKKLQKMLDAGSFQEALEAMYSHLGREHENLVLKYSGMLDAFVPKSFDVRRPRTTEFIAESNSERGFFSMHSLPSPRPAIPLTTDPRAAFRWPSFADCAAWCSENPGFHPHALVQL